MFWGRRQRRGALLKCVVASCVVEDTEGGWRRGWVRKQGQQHGEIVMCKGERGGKKLFLQTSSSSGQGRV